MWALLPTSTERGHRALLTHEAITLNHEARTFARASDVALGVGPAGVVAGVVLLVVAPRKASGVTVGGTVDGRSFSIMVRGAF
jgi:hypothetical protein